jgi:predicted nucleic acid-binding protein
MRVLVDTNVLTRIAHKNHAHASVATGAIERLLSEGHELRIVPQVLYEYWSVGTRPVEQNGLGFSAEVVDADVSRFKRIFSVLRDERTILEIWQQVCRTYRVIGKQAHDARLVAAMERHHLTHLLTFNLADFRRYAGVELLDPHSQAASPK